MQAVSSLETVAEETGFSRDAVASMLRSLQQGSGTMSQFDHPEFGGHGQWMRGGMIMLSDWSDRALRQRVDALCVRLAELIAHGEVPPLRAGDPGWPAVFGAPSTSGSQNGVRYAWFPAARRLVIDDAGRRTVYDTGEHRIGGVAQQQGATRTLSFTSESGPVSLEAFERIDDTRSDAEPGRTPSTPTPVGPANPSDPFDTLERLAALRERGVISAADFDAKKAEILERI